jgi:hypothetical protein
LDTRHDAGGLFLPGRVWKETAVDEDGVQLFDVVGEGHFLQIGPVIGAEFFESVFVGFFEAGAIAGLVCGKEAEFVIAEEGKRTVGAGEVDDLAAVRAAVDEVADEDELVVGLKLEALEQLGKFGVAAVDVADGDDTSLHGAAGGKLASVASGDK